MNLQWPKWPKQRNNWSGGQAYGKGPQKYTPNNGIDVQVIRIGLNRVPLSPGVNKPFPGLITFCGLPATTGLA